MLAEYVTTMQLVATRDGAMIAGQGGRRLKTTAFLMDMSGKRMPNQ
jgi:hypothetical protein